jgi:hypothetical protein
MNGREKSHSAIVAVKPTNKAGQPVAEPVEPRAGTEGNAKPGDTLWTPSQESASHGLDGVREGSRGRESNPTLTLASPSTTRGRNRMPELGTYGSVRGALSNERPYRDLKRESGRGPSTGRARSPTRQKRRQTSNPDGGMASWMVAFATMTCTSSPWRGCGKNIFLEHSFCC